MAEAIGIASGLIGIADMGFKLTTALYRFAKTYSTADSEVEGIANTISVTATILVTLGELIQDDPRDLNKLKRWATVPDTIAMCQKDFERIQNALGLAKAGTLPAQTNAPSRGKAVSLSPWQKIQLAIGGIEELDKLLLQLERSKLNLELVLGVVNYDTLRDLRKSNQMSPDLTQQWEEMKAILPWLVANLKMLQGQGTRPSNESAHREPAPAATVVIQNPYPAPPPVMLTARPLTSSRHSLDSATQPFGGESPQDPNRTPAPGRHNGDPPPSTAPAVVATSGATGSVSSIPARGDGDGHSSADRPFHEIWLLRYERRRGSPRRHRNGYQVSIRHTPFSVTLMSVSIKSPEYVFTRIQVPNRPELVREIAEKKKAHPPVHEVELMLPSLALAAINKLLKRRRYRKPEVELIVLETPSVWDWLTRRHKKTPSFTVYLSCELELDPDEEYSSSFGTGIGYTSDSEIFPMAPGSAGTGIAIEDEVEDVAIHGPFIPGPRPSIRRSYEGGSPARFRYRMRATSPGTPSIRTTGAAVPSPSLTAEEEAEKFMDDFLDRLNEPEEEEAEDEEVEVEEE